MIKGHKAPYFICISSDLACSLTGVVVIEDQGEKRISLPHWTVGLVAPESAVGLTKW